MYLCDQSLVTLAFLWKKSSQPQFYKDFITKTIFFERWSWFKSNNLELALGTNLKFDASVAKGLKLKFKKFWGPIPTFAKVTGEKLLGGLFCPPPPILNRVKVKNLWAWYKLWKLSSIIWNRLNKGQSRNTTQRWYFITEVTQKNLANNEGIAKGKLAYNSPP